MVEAPSVTAGGEYESLAAALLPIMFLVNCCIRHQKTVNNASHFSSRVLFCFQNPETQFTVIENRKSSLSSDCLLIDLLSIHDSFLKSFLKSAVESCGLLERCLCS